MKLKLKKLEKLHQEATKGPYRWAKDGCLRAKDGTIMMDEHDGEKSAIKDGNFIKASYENLPKLISWAKRARLILVDDLEAEKCSLERWGRGLVNNSAKEAILERISKRMAELEELLGELEE